MAARLLVVALVPFGFMIHLARGDLADAARTVEVADQFIDVVAVERDVVAVMAPSYIEQLAQVGLGSIDALADRGVTRELVISTVGIDYVAIYEANQIDLDRSIATLAVNHGSLILPDGRTLGSALGTFTARLEFQRDRTEARAGEVEPVIELFGHLDAVLDSALAAARLDWDADRLPMELARFDAQSNSLDWVLRTSRERGQAFLDAATLTGRHRLPIIGADEGHRQAVERFVTLLGSREADAFRTVVDGLVVPYDQIPEETTDLASVDFGWVLVASQLVLQATEYQRWLGDWSDGYYASMGAEAQQLADDARDDRDRLWWSVVSIGLVVVLIVLVLTRSLVRPVVALARRAGEISAGRVALSPLPVRGPKSLRRLTRSVNTMQQTLDLIDRQVGALAAGRLDDPALAEVAPGPLGEAVASSVVRLADVTSLLHDSEARASAVVSHAAVAIWTVDGAGVIQSANSAAEVVLAMPSERQVGRGLAAFIPVVRGECEVVREDGSRLWLDVDRSEVTIGAGATGERLVTVIGEDITERKEFERRLAHQARHDALTGILNRFAVLEHLDALAERSASAAVLFLDVDGFKSVNDSQGHGVGDQVLVEIARRLQSEVRSGAMVARLGGDEFVVVIDEAPQMDGLVRLGRRLVERLEQPFEVGDSLFGLSASVGVSVLLPGDTALDVVHRADAAVYQAKERGRGRVEVFDEAIQARIEQRAELELALRDAVAGGELDVVVQPVFDVVGDRIHGVEALVRWNRPGHGPVPPAEFIPVAESGALIVEITRFVLRRACETAARWREADPRCGLRVSVNLSGRHLIDGDLLGDLDDVLAATGADPRMLELELTETQLLADLSGVSDVLEAVRELGVTIAVDDFGTGFSSMSYLRTLPVDAIKIDRSFVQGAGERGFDSTAIDAMVNFGRVLGVDVVAEGVETQAQLDYVRARGCTRVQGYFFARPMSIVDFERRYSLSRPQSSAPGAFQVANSV